MRPVSGRPQTALVLLSIFFLGSPHLVSRRRDRKGEQVAGKKFQTVITLIHAQISQHRNGNIFHNPIKRSEAPDYYEIVKRPMDLKTIKARIRDGLISNSAEFQRDVYLMFANAMMFNRPNSDIYMMAEDVRPSFSVLPMFNRLFV
jgi:bromodomain-containing protein 8